MEKFTRLTGVAAPLPMVNVDTDMVIPKNYLKVTERTGLGKHLFAEMRFNADGSERPDFVLNRPAWRRAEILVAFENFGCGSSREHAPWALRDFGIRCVIAPSFADIFFNNCFKNGVLPIVLPQEQIDLLLREAAEAKDPTFTIDLESQEIHRPLGNEVLRFAVDPFRKHCLLNGLDDVGLTMQKARRIDDFEAKQRSTAPWLYRPGSASAEVA
jgi:3-isopropylmalate/(R)-2-methylmalate dehydratase small subunit